MNISFDEAYKSRVQAALDEVGEGHNADDAIKLVGWSIGRGREFPWWEAHKAEIMQSEGGYRNVHQSVMALTIAMLKQNPEQELADAAMYAGSEWRKDIRRQHDVGDGPIATPMSLQEVAERYATTVEGRMVLSEQDALDTIVHKHLKPEPYPESFDETQMSDPRLRLAWELASEKERELMRLVADGLTVKAAAQNLGITQSGGAMRVRKLRKKLEAAGAYATGA